MYPKRLSPDAPGSRLQMLDDLAVRYPFLMSPNVFGDRSRHGWMVVCILLFILCAGLYELLESGGLIPHHQTVNLFSDDGWKAGEIRDCDMTIANTSTKDADGILAVRCPSINEKQRLQITTVTFWGRVTSHDLIGMRVPITPRWRCTRHNDGIVCHGSR